MEVIVNSEKLTKINKENKKKLMIMIIMKWMKKSINSQY